ncbi:transferase [Prunus dulcis]|uniref:Transferase n=1 Tax=Prunus dulcis TaxID=3755 RepID=A0A4Y1RDB6_PRUDU|nr:transferase [Prunus dulcis]
MQLRVELKMKSKKINDCLNRFHVAMPKPRDNKERPPCIPQAVLEAKLSKQQRRKRETQKGIWRMRMAVQKNYILANDEWKEDVMPEILDGHNIYDFVDPDILHRLEELEREEGHRQAEEGDDDFEMDGLELTPEEQKTLAEIRKKKSLLIQQHRIKKSTAESRPTVPRKFDKDRKFTTKRMGRQLSKLGLDPTKAINRARSRSVSTRGRKRERSLDRDDTDGGDAMDVDTPNKKQRMLSRSRSRSRSRPPTEVVPGEGFKDSAQKAKALQKANKSNKMRNKNARRGEADSTCSLENDQLEKLKGVKIFEGVRFVICCIMHHGVYLLLKKNLVLSSLVRQEIAALEIMQSESRMRDGILQLPATKSDEAFLLNVGD